MNKQRIVTIGKYLLLWFFLDIIIVLGIGQINVPKFWSLYKRGIKVDGVVLQKEPENHQSVHFSYLGPNITYTNIYGHAGYGNPGFEDLKIGEKIIVFYDPENPEISVMGYPKGYLDNEIISIALGCIIFPPLIIFAIKRADKRNALKNWKECVICLITMIIKPHSV